MTSASPLPAAACINAIGTAVPDNDVHHAFVEWAAAQLEDERERSVFARMAQRSGIGHRWSVLPVPAGGRSPVDAGGFYAGAWPTTAERMRMYGDAAPRLAESAVEDLARKADIGAVTHLILASCTGFVAPGVDQILARRLGLAPSVERLLIGYMGCYAGITALRSARHIVRSVPDARVLVICVELSSLHLQRHASLEPLLAMLQFGDGAAAALVTAEQRGIAMGEPLSATLPDSEELIRWDLGDHGFAMHLSGAVPGRIAEALRDPGFLPAAPDSVERWAVHAGGRSILDAVEQALSLSAEALADSRAVLAEYGNMSSGTVLFVLARMLAQDASGRGLALAFGPGLATEGFFFDRAGHGQ
ncbi:type III polyketide synthase [Sphingobium bisphenolivorans]|uniref:type III polyketide synthase n=1 Tax=Sphingobium bisphenolivorans TaxID=1335760 RepID=UPI00039FAEDB|nr:type III polyketide synthase [Sphingobium bisphenolivorans]